MLSPSSIGGLVNQIGGFSSSLMNGLDPNVIASVLNNNIPFMTALSNNTTRR